MNSELGTCRHAKMTSVMDFQNFSVFGDDSQLWVYPFREPLTEPTSRLIEQTLNGFLPTWVSHGDPVKGRFVIHEERFLLLTGDCSAGISGCAIDSSVQNFKALRDQHGLDGLDRSLVFFRDTEGRILAQHFLDFQKLTSSGRILPDTPVFDTTITTLGELRAGDLEKPFRDSWHAARFS